MPVLSTKDVMSKGYGHEATMNIMRAIGYKIKGGKRWYVDADDLEAYIVECKQRQKDSQRAPLQKKASNSDFSLEEMRIPKPSYR